MTLIFNKTVQGALKEIDTYQYQEFMVNEPNQPTPLGSIPNNYAESKWQIVEMLNQTYSQILKNKFDLYNWLYHHKEDEVAYFLNETGSNALNYSEFKIPSKFHLWLGSKGFIIGIEQQGWGFNAAKIDKEKIKEKEGAAFEFYRNCKSTVFFDNPEEARIVYLVYLF